MPSLPSWMAEPEPIVAGDPVDMRVRAKVDVCEGVTALELVTASGEEVPAWEPGAHIDVHLPGGVVRQYSLHSDPSDRTALGVAVLREPDGRGGSVFVHDRLAVGDVVAVGGPRNHFRLEPAPRYLFIAGGIGITPILPMLASVSRSGVEWSLTYGGRSRASMAFLDAVADDPRVTVVPQDELGLLDLAALLDVPRFGTAVYCCGPEPLMQAVERATGHWPVGALHLERFKPRDDLPSGPGTPFEVELARSGVDVTIPAGRSILDTLAARGVKVPSSCREGTCGTCETVVLDGEPEHRDSILTPAERAANDCMMICCSRARSDRLVLDL